MPPQPSVPGSPIQGQPSVVASPEAATSLATQGVRYQKKHTPIFKAPTGELQLQDNTVTFIDNTGNKLVTLAVSSLQAITRSSTTLLLKDTTDTYMFWFPGSGAAMGGMLLGGAIGLAIDYKAQKKSGIEQWMQALQIANPNAKIRNWGFGKSMKVGLFLAGVIFLITIIIVIIASFTSR